MRKLAILVPTFNRAALLRRALSSLVAQVGEAATVELIVIDDNSTHATPDVPDALVTTRVRPERLTGEYHGRWHRGHGRFSAVMRTTELDQARQRLFGVPAHLFRSAVSDAAAWLREVVARDNARAFAAETRLWFFSGFLKERCACLARR